MSQLRHIRLAGLSLSDPPPLPSESHDGDTMILKNLQSAESMINLSFSDDLVERIPNLRILWARYEDEVEGFQSEAEYALENIARLEKLVCRLADVGSITRRNSMISGLAFPHSLKDLTVSGLRLDDVTTKIGSLPLLKDLTLYECSGSEWEHVEGQFERLKCLELFCCSELECFTADSSYFPRLEELELYLMSGLKEVSSDISEILRR